MCIPSFYLDHVECFQPILSGFYHEHSGRDRNGYVRILWDNIKFFKKHNFRKCKGCSEQNLPYDLDSIMHYGAYLFSKNGEKTIEVIGNPNYPIGHASNLSSTDIKRINLLYDCAGKI